MHPAKHVKVGDIVNYRLADHDVTAINDRRRVLNGSGNHVNSGDIYPMIVVRVWSEDMVNGQVMLDGPDTYWATSRHRGVMSSNWCWPGNDASEEEWR